MIKMIKHMKICIFKDSNKGASLLEVLIAMVILAVGFLGVIALSTFLFKGNAQTTNMNIASEIAEMQMSQLNCLGATKALSPFPFTSSPIAVAACPSGDTCYEYEITPTVLNPVTKTDTRTNVTACINPVLTRGGPAPGSLPPGGLGITTTYYVKLVNNTTANQPVDATITVSWIYGQGRKAVTFYGVI